VTSGPHAPAGTRAPGYVCRGWSNHDAVVSSLVQRRHSDRRAARFRTCPTLPGGKVAGAGRSRRCFPVWRHMPQRPYALDHEGSCLPGGPARPLFTLARHCLPGLSRSAGTVAVKSQGRGVVSRGAGGLRIWRAMPRGQTLQDHGTGAGRPGGARRAGTARGRVVGGVKPGCGTGRDGAVAQAGKACWRRVAISFSTRGAGSGSPIPKRSAPDENA